MRLRLKEQLKAFLSSYYAIMGILFGSALVSFSLGPYSNFDSMTEYSAASGIIKWGFPYLTLGSWINEPPLGYYIDAPIFKGFGLSYSTGTAIITLFGLGCVFLVYELGKVLYEKRTGLVAAALFGLIPWEVVVSRSFLDDAQCLFFSLLFLLLGIWAIRKGSLKLFLAAGIIFGLAFLVKIFAVFTLIPLALIYLYYRPKRLKSTLAEIAVFFVPAFIMNYVWYQVITGRGLIFIFSHDDFSNYNPAGAAPSYSFLASYFVGALGILFLAACALSLFISLSRRKLFAKILVPELIFLVTIIGVSVLNIYLAIGRNLVVPYHDPFKYDYQLLPLFCWLAASLITKIHALHNPLNSKNKRDKLAFYITVVALILLAGSILQNTNTLNGFTSQNYLLFRVEKDVGYSFDRLTPTVQPNYAVLVQLVGFVLIVLSVLWANQNTLTSLHKTRPAVNSTAQEKASSSFSSSTKQSRTIENRSKSSEQKN